MALRLPESVLGWCGRGLPLFWGTVALLLLWVAAPASADSVKGYVDLIYSKSDSVFTDATGTMTNTESRSMIQQYSLSFDKNLWPNLRLFASGTFRQTNADSVTNDERTSSTTLMTRPYVELSLGTPLYQIGANYGKVTTEQRSAGFKSVLISETTTGYLGWKPADLPTLDIRATETKNYDKDRLQFDTVSDSLGVTSTYSPISTVQLRYYGSYIDHRDLLGGTETMIVGHDGKMDYSDRFFKDRVSFTASEEIAASETNIKARAGQSSISFQVLAARGISLNTFDVQGLSRVPLADAPFLIDNSFSAPRSDANNIGSSLYPTDTTPRNVGLQFAVPTEVNTLDVWVYSVHDIRSPDATQDFLTASVAASFTWAVYTSTDNISWTLYQSAVPASYLPFAAQLGVGKFEITFPNVTAQYIKLVVSPLLPSAGGGTAADFPGVYVTELQAFNTTAAQSAQNKRSTTTETTNVSTKVKLLEDRFLFYDFSYFEVRSDTSSVISRNSTMLNGLSYSQQFSRVFSGSASVQRMDTKTSPLGQDTVVYQLYAVVQAVPLRTLNQSVSVNEQIRETETGRSTSQSYYITNNAELYRNVTVYLNGGQTWETDEFHERTRSYQYSYGGSVTPLKTLIISGGSVYSKFNTYYSRSDNISLAYNPFPLLYLSAGLTTVADSNRRNTLQNYNASWSPFPGGALQIGVSYSETLMTQDNSVTQSLSESVRWNVNRRTAVQVSYGDSKNTSDISRTTTRAITAEFTMIL